MRLLANENIPLVSVRILRETGHDVVSITERSPGILDEAVMEIGHTEQRIIITFDRDYGELVFRRRLPAPAGVLYLRFLPMLPLEPAEYVAQLIASVIALKGVRDAGVVESGSGKVRLLKWAEYEAGWDPTEDHRIPVWEACHQMIRGLKDQGESAAGDLLAKMPEKGESIRQLAYHLYTLCERKKWAEEARAYNELIGSWHAIVAASHDVRHVGSQTELGLNF